jgi:hypothetical protein
LRNIVQLLSRRRQPIDSITTLLRLELRQGIRKLGLQRQHLLPRHRIIMLERNLVDHIAQMLQAIPQTTGNGWRRLQPRADWCGAACGLLILRGLGHQEPIKL